MANQFRAEADKIYRNPETGQTVSYTKSQLASNPALGSLSNQFQEYNPTDTGNSGATGGSDDFNLDNLTEGLVSPMDEMGNIRESEKFKTGAEIIREGADATFNPQIRRAMATGRSQVDTAQGITGQRMGMNLSSAELSYISSMQSEVNNRIGELEKQKQSYIDQGLLDLANELENQKFQLIQANNDLVLKKANLGLNIRQQQTSERQFEKTFGLSERQFEQNQNEFKEELAIQVANLTGIYEETGEKTFQAKQAEIQNALQEANLTGYYEGEETFARFSARLDRELREKGIQIDRDRLNETIRANKAQERISRSRIAEQTEKVTNDLSFEGLSFTEAKKKAGEYMADMGTNLDNTTWKVVLNRLAEKYELPQEFVTDPETGKEYDQSWAELKGDMEDITRSYRTDQEVAETSLFGGTDFTDEYFISPETNETVSIIRGIYEKANNEGYIPGGGVNANMNKAEKIINDLTINLSPEQKAKVIGMAKS